jgi:hypothetical protein
VNEDVSSFSCNSNFEITLKTKTQKIENERRYRRGRNLKYYAAYCSRLHMKPVAAILPIY